MFLWGVSGSTPTSGIFYVPTNPASRGDVGDMCVLVFFGFPALLVKVAHFLLGCFLLLWEGGSFALLVPVGTYSFAPHHGNWCHYSSLQELCSSESLRLRFLGLTTLVGEVMTLTLAKAATRCARVACMLCWYCEKDEFILHRFAYSHPV